MARMPGAIWKPLAANWASQSRMRAYDFFCLHTMVGTLAGTGTYFEKTNGPGYSGTESHFGVGPDGTIWQFQDTDFQADANYNGSWHVISSENADTGAPFPKWGGSDVPAFTPEQVEANAHIAVWLNQTHGIPLDLTPDSKPGRRGLAVHRWGVPGYMVAGAEQWSTSQGKACPGNRRIEQAPQISARAKQILTGDDMPLTDDDIRRIYHYGFEKVDAGGKPTGRGVNLAEFLKWDDAKIGTVLDGNAKLQGQLAGLTAALQQLAAAPGQSIDLAAVQEAARAGAQEALASGVDVDITVGGQAAGKPA